MTVYREMPNYIVRFSMRRVECLISASSQDISRRRAFCRILSRFRSPLQSKQNENYITEFFCDGLRIRFKTSAELTWTLIFTIYDCVGCNGKPTWMTRAVALSNNVMAAEIRRLVGWNHGHRWLKSIEKTCYRRRNTSSTIQFDLVCANLNNPFAVPESSLTRTVPPLTLPL